MIATRSNKSDCISCQIRDGIPTTSGRAYYASQKGTRILVVERGIGQRIRINGEIEIVVYGTGKNEVQLGIEGASDGMY